ncbi:hypothetical protein OZ410_09280 [Robiginitalea sp. M366]|uniref:hypothetical protein n=1 Tax=Robiginitalea aestuariiviva TaxID=3036903 RepID=UPI00240D7C00|nr:hypothetical protein [Robiginitalea aestuariiviva]MDG1572507.1 hypothetical protein [Robiginitalea aestuariiviva]
MELAQRHLIKIKWTARMAIASLGILTIALVVNYFREPLLGFNKGYGPHNFTFNFIFFLPSLATALGLGLAVIGRTLKHWNTWKDSNKKWTLIGLSFPAIGFWIFMIIRIFTLTTD